MSKVAWIIFGAIIVLVLGGLVVYSRSANPSIDVSSIDANAITAASEQNGQIGDHVLGSPDTKAVIIEYGDFQCPSCGGAHPQVKEIAEEYGDKITFVFRNFPLTTIHPNARAAAAAAEAASLQGKYWEMHDLLFENQSDWESLTGTARTDAFVGYASTLGLDKDTFTADIASSAVSQKISFDQAIAKKINVTATPTFYLNGTKLDETVSNNIVQSDGSELKKLIDEALK